MKYMNLKEWNCPHLTRKRDDVFRIHMPEGERKPIYALWAPKSYNAWGDTKLHALGPFWGPKRTLCGPITMRKLLKLHTVPNPS